MINLSDNEFYEVEAIRGRRWDEESNDYIYCIKWLGYGEHENTWELKSQMDCAKILHDFEKQCRKVFGNENYDKYDILFDEKNRLLQPLKSKSEKKKKLKKKGRRILSDDEKDESETLVIATTAEQSDHHVHTDHHVHIDHRTHNSIASKKSASRQKTKNSAFTNDEVQKQEYDYVWELEEEEEEEDFIYNPYVHPFKIIDELDDGNNGFDRGWELERIVAIVGVDLENGRKLNCAIVKFKKYRYAQRISTSKVMMHAKDALIEFLISGLDHITK